MGTNRRTLLGALVFLLALPVSSFARGDLVDALNDIRARGCDGKRGVSTSLRGQRRLDDAARRMMGGGKLGTALKAVDYRAMHSSSLRLTNPGTDADVARALARRSCDQLLDAEIREVGVARKGKGIWIILAAPFAAPALENAAAVRTRVLALANEARSRVRRCGRKQFAATTPLRLAEPLNAAARDHSRDMADHSQLAHEGSDGSTPAQRVTRAGYRWRIVGENVAAGPTTAEEVMQGWLDSPPHCENLMDPRFTELGVGFVFDAGSESGVYWAQVFAVPARLPLQ